jgi:hypothetical protein
VNYLIYLVSLTLTLYLLGPLDVALARRIPAVPPTYPWIPAFFSLWPPLVGSGQFLNGQYLKAAFLLVVFWGWRSFLLPMPRPFYGLSWPPILAPLVIAGAIDAYWRARRRWMAANQPASTEEQARLASFFKRLTQHRGA